MVRGGAGQRTAGKEHVMQPASSLLLINALTAWQQLLVHPHEVAVGLEVGDIDVVETDQRVEQADCRWRAERGGARKWGGRRAWQPPAGYTARTALPHGRLATPPLAHTSCPTPRQLQSLTVGLGEAVAHDVALPPQDLLALVQRGKQLAKRCGRQQEDARNGRKGEEVQGACRGGNGMDGGQAGPPAALACCDGERNGGPIACCNPSPCSYASWLVAKPQRYTPAVQGRRWNAGAFMRGKHSSKGGHSFASSLV